VLLVVSSTGGTPAVTFTYVNANDGATIDVVDGSIFAVGEEITIQDITNLERKVISNIATNTLTVPALTNGYAIGSPVYRSRVTTVNEYAEFKNSVDDPYDSVISSPLESHSATLAACAYSEDGNYLAVVSSISPYLYVYSISGDTYTKLDDPSSLPSGTPSTVAINADGTQIVINYASAPYLNFFKRVGSTLSELSDSTTTGAAVIQVDMDGDGTFIIAVTASSPYVHMFERASDTWTKLSNPASLPTAAGKGCGISSDGIYSHVVLGVASPNSIKVYKRTGSVFAVLAPPGTQVASSGKGTMSKDGTWIFAATSTTPRIVAYHRIGDVWTNIIYPSTANIGVVNIAITQDNKALLVGLNDSPYSWAFEIDGLTITERSTLTPTPAPTNQVGGLAFRLNGENSIYGQTVPPYYGNYKASLISFLITDMRYNITPVETVKQVIAWIQRNIISGYVLTASVSIVDTSDPESYNSMDKVTRTITGGEEDEFEYFGSIAEEKITLRITLTRTSTSDDAQITKILGAID